jgi:hypothetical protein
MYVVTVLCVVALVFARAVHAANPNTINYQIHSWNDLREWPSALAKGVRYLKLDPHYMTSDFCAQSVMGIHDARGCFPLNHDTPVPTEPYFTLSDVLDFVSQPSLDRSIHLTLAVCVKFGVDVCGSSSDASNMLALMDEFFHTAQALITSGKINVEFVLDGSVTVGHSCFAQRWRPWNSTYIPGQDPVDAAFSNDAEKGYDRLLVLNPEVGPSLDPSFTLQLLHDVGFGKFPKSQYDVQLWEPSPELHVRKVADYWRETVWDMPVHKKLRFATNTDPMQCLRYAGASTVEHEFPFQQFMGSAVDHSDHTILFLAPTGELMVQHAENGTLVAAGLVPFSSSVVNVDWKKGSLLVANETASVVYSARFELAVVRLTLEQVIHAPSGNAQIAAATFTNSGSVVFAYTLTTDANSVCVSSPAVCFKHSQPIAHVALRTNSKDASVVAFSDVKRNVFVWDTSSSATVATEIGIGTFMSLDHVCDATTSNCVFGLVVGDGYCWNNEVFNKRPTPMLCDSEPYSMDNVMTYTIASEAVFVGSQMSMHVCHPDVMHGSIGMGASPLLNLFYGSAGQLMMSVVNGPVKSTSSPCGDAIERNGALWTVQPLPTMNS